MLEKIHDSSATHTDIVFEKVKCKYRCTMGHEYEESTIGRAGFNIKSVIEGKTMTSKNYCPLCLVPAFDKLMQSLEVGIVEEVKAEVKTP